MFHLLRASCRSADAQACLAQACFPAFSPCRLWACCSTCNWPTGSSHQPVNLPPDDELGPPLYSSYRGRITSHVLDLTEDQLLPQGAATGVCNHCPIPDACHLTRNHDPYRGNPMRWRRDHSRAFTIPMHERDPSGEILEKLETAFDSPSSGLSAGNRKQPQSFHSKSSYAVDPSH
jgi:hypothetical protein